MDLQELIEELVSDSAPHLARDERGRQQTKEYLAAESVDCTPDGHVIFLQSGQEYHTHRCVCDACEPE
jgi:hypothetical protein